MRAERRRVERPEGHVRLRLRTPVLELESWTSRALRLLCYSPHARPGPTSAQFVHSASDPPQNGQGVVYWGETADQTASRAKNIQNRPVLQQASSESQAMQLQQMQASLRALQEENSQLQQRLLSAASPAPPPVGIAAGFATAADPKEVAALKHEVEKLKTGAALMRRSNETLLRENQQLQMKLSRLEHVFEEQN